MTTPRSVLNAAYPLLEPGEDCDPYAYPNGCGFDEYCSGECS
jgi:hypothetical protein